MYTPGLAYVAREGTAAALLKCSGLSVSIALSMTVIRQSTFVRDGKISPGHLLLLLLRVAPDRPRDHDKKVRKRECVYVCVIGKYACAAGVGCVYIDGKGGGGGDELKR